MIHHTAPTTNRTRTRIAALVLATALAATACSSQSQSTATTTTEPADEIGEPVIAGEVTVEHSGAITEQPVFVPPADPPPSWPAVQLTNVAKTAPPPAITLLPEPVEVPTGGQIGDLTSDAVGCASNCISNALLHFRDRSADLDFTIATNVDTLVAVWLARYAPTYSGDIISFPGVPATENSVKYDDKWEATLDALLYDTTYHLVLRVTDQYGNKQYATTEVTTRKAPGPADLVGNADGCALECIKSAIVTPSATYSEVNIEVTTNEAAVFEVAVSTQTPGWIGDSPILPAQAPVTTTDVGATSFKGTASQLQGDTEYHIVVRATDSDGFYAFAVGSFRTAPLPPRVSIPTPVMVSFEDVVILYDGDKGKLNRGEIELLWGLGGEGFYVGTRATDKLTDGDVVELPSDAATWVMVEPGATLPDVVVNARERDRVAGEGLCIGGHGLGYEPVYSSACGTSTNVAELNGLTVEWILDQELCSEFGLTGSEADDYCYRVRSPDMGDDFVLFTALLRFRVAG